MNKQSRPVTQHVPPHPGASSAQVSARMSGLHRRDNAHEMALRRALHSLGLRYRVSYRVPGAPRRTIDVAFTGRKIAVFVDGCFWHGCVDHGTKPRSNPEWWQRKLLANQDRDRDTNRLLQEQGWTVVRIWEHESLASAVRRVVEAQV